MEDTALTRSPLSHFDAADDAAAQAEITSRGLTLFITPPQKQRHIFTVAATTNPQLVAPFLALDPVLTKANEDAVTVSTSPGGKTITTVDWSAARALFATVVTTTPEQAALKAQLLACYP